MSRPYGSLEDAWISDQKWIWSEQAGRDIGVPETVDRILRLNEEAKKHSKVHYSDNAFMSWLQGHTFLLREELIQGYLFSVHSERLQGELKRFVSSRDGISADRVDINYNSIRAYCETNNLNPAMGLKMLIELKLFPFSRVSLAA